MAFHQVRFPLDVALGARGGPERATDIVTLQSGREERNQRWAQSRRRYDAGLGVRSLDDLAEVVAFFEARHGQLHAFPWKDWTDFKSCLPSRQPAAMDQVIGKGDGAETVFGLCKAYTSGGQSYFRAIAKPVVGTVTVAVGQERVAGERGLSIGYAAMLEQFHPTEAIELAVHAESRGFSGVMAADHFQPWVPAQGQSAFVWNVLAALGERTRGDIGPGVTAPTFRWHPAMVAQASATLAAMYPGRHWLGLGSGEALNEHVVAGYWPEAPERINRMFEAIDSCPAPVVAVVHGHALGGGVGLVACSDVVIADPRTVFAFSEVKLGIVPAVISPFALRKIGESAARRYFVTGERFDAETALRIGLVHEVTSDLDAALGRVLAELRTAGPRAARHAKRLVLDRPDGAETARLIAERRTSDEGQEGLHAFLERRRPAWAPAADNEES